MSEGPKDFEKHIKTQLLRLSHLLGYPTETVALRDYIAALSVAQTYEGAIRVMDAIVQEWITRDCPTSAHIRVKAWEDRERQEKPAAEPARTRCPRCQDLGILESTHVDDFASVASYCTCPSGHARERRTDDPYSPERINATRVKARALFPGGNPLPGIAARARRPRNPDTVYHGEF